MAISAFDLFKVGIGPSSSHTVGPMLAANQFVKALKSHGLLDQVSRVTAELYGSLGATGKGHGTPKAVLLGLEGEVPDQVHVPTIAGRVAAIRDNRRLCLLGEHAIDYNHDLDFKLHRRKALAFHPNGMVFAAFDQSGNELSKRTFFSVGGGFVVDESATDSDYIVEDSKQLTYGFDSANELLQICADHDLSISDVMLENETAWRPEQETRDGLLHLWSVMQSCVNNGIANGGILPGGLNVPRRARELHQHLLHLPETAMADPLAVLDWVTLYALAVNEENAAGGRVVTAPTNGAAGIIPAVLHYYMRFIPDASDEMAVRFLLTAAAIGILYKKNASISGAEVGCQGEVGSALDNFFHELLLVIGVKSFLCPCSGSFQRFFLRFYLKDISFFLLLFRSKT